MSNKTWPKKAFKAIIILAIVAIPLIYSFFYLKAFWDPYGNTNQIPVAIVNLDKGYEDKNLGEELIKTISEKDVLKLCLEDEEQAKQKLIDREYYAVITIPEDFSKNLETAESQDRQISLITYSPNQKTNYLASQIINKVVSTVELELHKQVSGEVVNKLVDKLNDVPEEMQPISEAVTKLKDGSKEIAEGTEKISTGLKSLNSNYTQFNNVINKLDDVKLDEGFEEIEKIQKEVKDLLNSTGDISSLKSEITDIVTNITILKNGISDYITNVSKLNENTKRVLQGIVDYGNANPELKEDSNFMIIYTGASQILESKSFEGLDAAGTNIQNGIKQLESGMSKLNQVMEKFDTLTNRTEELKTVLDKVSSSVGNAKGKITELQSGIKKLVSSSNQIQLGIRDLATGSDTLLSGTKSLYDGTSTFQDEINNSISETRDELTKLNGLSEYTEEPIQIEEDDYSHVDTYGIVFAPYFMSLSLWVGALVLFVVLYYDADNRFKLLGREADNKILRAFLYLLLAIAQALILGFFLKLFLGFEVTNIWLYYGACILISTVFLAIIQFLIVNFGDVGKFLAILFLILQLAASGGTFPIETSPQFFQNLYPYMPMHYSINLIKESLITIDNGFVGGNVGILLGILFICVIFTILFDLIKVIKRVIKKKKEKNNKIK